MLSDSYYNISANSQLKNLLGERKNDVAKFLLQDYVICNEEFSRSSWVTNDYLTKVKLLYLGYLSTDIASSAEFQMLIGDNPISVELFDKWWNINRVKVDESDFLENQIKEKGHLNFAPTGSSVINEWLNSLNNRH